MATRSRSRERVTGGVSREGGIPGTMTGMRRTWPWAAALVLSGCAMLRPSGSEGVDRAAELARVRCLLVAPFENASDTPLAADSATAALVGGIDATRTVVYPPADLRALFRDTPLELPPGIAPSLAIELAELLGADAALYGAIEGRGHEEGDLYVTLRLALSGDRSLLWASTAHARPGSGERPEAAVQRAVLESAKPLLAKLGDTGRKRCFDPEKTQALRELALAQGRSAVAAATPVVAPAAAAAAAPPAPEPPGPRDARTPRQSEWARRLAGQGRVVVDDVNFNGRSAEIARDAGLVDLAAALATVPDVKVRLEGFVDATAEPAADSKLSHAMAQAAAKRLVQLGVSQGRVSVAGRGSESPVLPNFTARGRAANRRIEVVGLR